MTPMRFECDSCHAKYKISDEKVRGRVVRFPCRKCDHKILIDGRQINADVTVPGGAAYGFEDVTRRSEPVSSFQHEAPTARARRPAAPARRRPPSVPPRRPAAVSRKLSPAPSVASTTRDGQHPGLAPPVPAAPGRTSDVGTREVPEWHVSIHDVPVGPIRLEEMAHKIDAGAVSEYSLVWRDGFEEWRPLATVPELMALLHERRVSGLPSRTSFSSVPPFVETRASSDSLSDLTPLADSLQPEPGFGPLNETSQPPSPIGPEDIFQSSPSLGAFSGLPSFEDEPVSVPSVPPEPAQASIEPRRGPSLGVLALIVSIAVFAGVAAFLAFDRFGDSSWTQWLGKGRSTPPATSAAAVKRPAEAPPATPQAPVELAAAEKTEGAEEAEAVAAAPVVEGEAPAEAPAAKPAETLAVPPPPNPADDGPTIAPVRTRRAPDRPSPRTEAAANAADENGSLSDEDEKVLRDFRSSSAAGPAAIDVQPSRSAQDDKPPLDSDGVRATVTANKPRLQRCYERAIRGQQSPPAVRLDVSVTVASSGRVKDVSAEGEGPGGLAECVEASVRRWRFPASSEGGPAQFPIVFSAN